MPFGRRVVAAFRNLTTMLVGFYTLAMLAFCLVWVVAPERTWWIALSNVIAPHLFLPLLLIIPFAIVLRSRAIGLMAGGLLMLFVAQSGSHLLPHSLSALSNTRPEGSLRVVTFNQLYRNDDPQGSLAVLKAQDADVIALQELSYTMVDAIMADRDVTTRYPYRWLQPEAHPAGVGILSRVPFIQLHGSGELWMQAVELSIQGQPMTFINAHPIAPAVGLGRLHDIRRLRWMGEWTREVPLIDSYNPKRRNEQIQALLDYIDNRPGQLILAGDLNTADRDPIYPQFATRMQDVFAEVGWGFGRSFPNARHEGRYPIPFPLVRIDYVWMRGDITPLHAHVVCDAEGSDHCMLVADVRVDD